MTHILRARLHDVPNVRFVTLDVHRPPPSHLRPALRRVLQRRPGRPAKGAVPTIVGWRVRGELVEKKAEIAQARQWKGRFILATNELNTEVLPDWEMLSAYKTQTASVERGFRFLKDPMFFADSLFLKSPARIMAMIMVMGLALLIYALAERELRRQLQLQNETIPHQTGTPTQAITMRRVAQIFEGIDLLVIYSGAVIVARKILNLSPVRLSRSKIHDKGTATAVIERT